jgi:hypothetical protein
MGLAVAHVPSAAGALQLYFYAHNQYDKSWIGHIQCPKQWEPLGKYFALFMHETYYEAWRLEGGKVRRAVAPVVGHYRRGGQRQEDSMNQYAIRRWVFISLLGGMFVLGFVSGSVRQRPAQAQVPGVGGVLGSVKDLGSSIVEMQQHVDGLQKNLATLKKVEAALGGGK